MRWKEMAFLFLLPALFFKNISSVWAIFSWDIISSVKVSVCGDGIIEGEEDCEGEDLNGQTCESLGYGPGTLSCDIACEFDVHDCSPAPTSTPTPTPTPTPTSTPTPIPLATATSTPTNTPTPEPASTSTATPTTTPTTTPTPIPILPPPVSFFDLDKTGRIEMAEVFAAVKSWVNNWQEVLKQKISPQEVSEKIGKNCDLNADEECDLIDFSILLYYVEK